MLHSLKIEGFRAFSDFELNGLGRVNLLVGTNNSGKTSVLEAVQMLKVTDGAGIFGSLWRRGEFINENEDSPRRVGVAYDWSQLFHGRNPTPGRKLRIASKDPQGNQEEVELAVSFAAKRMREGEDEANPRISFEQSDDGVTVLSAAWKPSEVQQSYEVDEPGVGGFEPTFLVPQRKLQRRPNVTNVVFVSTNSLTSEIVVDALELILLNPEEKEIVDALRQIDPRVNRFGTARRYGAGPIGFRGRIDRGGVFVQLEGTPRRVPLGSMGDGLWRVLSLAIGLLKARDGVLLVDDIDTGLHYSVQDKMWEMIAARAKALNVQVFATTHSSDCWKSLATISRRGVTKNSEVTIHRIEPNKSRSVPYSEQEIILAAERDTEVR